MSYRSCAALLLLLTAGIVRADEEIVIGRASRIHSDVLHEDRTLRTYLPRSYGWAADRRYPVLYLLDAETDFVHTAGSVDYLAAMGEIPEMIVVGVDSTVRIRDFTQTDWAEAWVGGGGAANFKAFLSKELLPKIDASYRTNGYRVLSGHSAGGQFALYCLTSDPSLFQAYFALSPSLDWDHELPRRSLEKALASTESLKAFLYVARSDDFGRALANDQRLVHTLETTAPRGLRWASGAFPEESHVSITLLAEIDALRHLFSGYRLSDDVLDLGMDFVQEHFDVQSKVVGYPIGVPENVVNDLAYSALSAGRTADAIALFRRNVEANPNSANAWDGLADGYAKAGRWQDAAAAADRAVDLAVRFDDPNRAAFAEHAKKMHDRLLDVEGRAGFAPIGPPRQEAPAHGPGCIPETGGGRATFAGMPSRHLQDYRWRGARALVLLHEQSMREFLPVWREAARRGVRLPATDDPDYVSLHTLLHHVLRASRGYMTWLCEKLGLPDPGIEAAPPADVVEREADRYLEHLLERWRAPLAGLGEDRLQPVFRTRWGAELSGESMLEHAVVHAMRHRFQLEELMEADGTAG